MNQYWFKHSARNLPLKLGLVPRLQPGVRAVLGQLDAGDRAGGMIQYRGSAFAGQPGDFILAGVAQPGIVRVRVSSNGAREVARIGLGACG